MTRGGMTMYDRVLGRTTAGLLVLGLASCAPAPEREGARSAVATLAPTEGHRAAGAVVFTEVDGGIRVVAAIVGVPEGAHGLHVHEHGDCSSPDGGSAGNHWNPEGVPHGGRLSPVRHVGDLGNVAADADGVVRADFIDGVIAFEGARSIVGRAVILHADEDDLVSHPSGAAGARIACGVIVSADRRGGAR